MPLSPFSTVGAASPAAPYVRSIVKAMKLPMTDIRNMDVEAEARHCLFSDADGDCFQAELGDATVAPRSIMQGALDASCTPDQRLLRAVTWLTPGSGEYPGNRVLRPVAMLGVLHTSVNALLQASPGDKMLEKQEEKVRNQIILLGRAIGACKHAPSGGYDIDDETASKALSKKHLKAAHTTVVECIQKIGSDRVFNTIAREFLAPAMLVALERENKAAHALAKEGKLDGDGVMNLLEPELVSFTNKQVQRELFKGNFNGYMEAMSELMKLPHYVMKGQSAKSGPAEDARKPRDNGIPQNLLDHSRGPGAPIAYNHNVIDLKDVGQAIRHTDQNNPAQLEWLANKLMEVYDLGFARGKEFGSLGQQLESIRNERDGLRAENERLSDQLNSKNREVADQQIKIAKPTELKVEVLDADQGPDVSVGDPGIMGSVTIHDSGTESVQFQGQGDVKVVEHPQALRAEPVQNRQESAVSDHGRDRPVEEVQLRRDSSVIQSSCSTVTTQLLGSDENSPLKNTVRAEDSSVLDLDRVGSGDQEVQDFITDLYDDLGLNEEGLRTRFTERRIPERGDTLFVKPAEEQENHTSSNGFGKRRAGKSNPNFDRLIKKFERLSSQNSGPVATTAIDVKRGEARASDSIGVPADREKSVLEPGVLIENARVDDGVKKVIEPGGKARKADEQPLDVLKRYLKVLHMSPADLKDEGLPRRHVQTGSVFFDKGRMTVAEQASGEQLETQLVMPSDVLAFQGRILHRNPSSLAGAQENAGKRSEEITGKDTVRIDNAAKHSAVKSMAAAIEGRMGQAPIARSQFGPAFKAAEKWADKHDAQQLTNVVQNVVSQEAPRFGSPTDVGRLLAADPKDIISSAFGGYARGALPAPILGPKTRAAHGMPLRMKHGSLFGPGVSARLNSTGSSIASSASSRSEASDSEGETPLPSAPAERKPKVLKGLREFPLKDTVSI